MFLPTVISLDLDDTLWATAPVIAAAERAMLAWFEARYPAAAAGVSLESMRAVRAQVAAAFPERSHDMTFLRRRALAVQFAAAGLEPAAADEAFEVFMTERNRVRLFPDVRPALERLRLRHRLFALSNGNADLGRCGLGDVFEGHVTAIAAGAGKPDPRIFEYLARTARVDAAEILHVGDDASADVGGARRAGLQAVWVNRDGRAWPLDAVPVPCTITTLAELG